MIPTKMARRFAAALAVPALLLTAACGSEESSGSVATVSGKPGKLPELNIDEDTEVSEETTAETVVEGDGEEVRKGDFLSMGAFAKTVGGDLELINTWVTPEGEPIPETEEDAEGDGAEPPRPQVVTQAGVESALPAAVTEKLVGERIGSRVLVQGQVGALLGEAATQAGLAEDDGVVWVFDINDAIDPTSMVEGEQAPAEDGMPEVEAEGKEPATITMPEGQDPPEELAEQVLIEGEGDEVQAGQNLIVQYTGVTWDEGEQFDSSWDRDAAALFQIGAGQVVAGWDEGLVGKNVGDRVLLVLPPSMGYGDEGAPPDIPGGATLVFVVDIVAAV